MDTFKCIQCGRDTNHSGICDLCLDSAHAENHRRDEEKVEIIEATRKGMERLRRAKERKYVNQSRTRRRVNKMRNDMMGLVIVPHVGHNWQDKLGKLKR